MAGVRNLKMWLTICSLMLVVVSAAPADTHYVAPGQSIQDAINAADPGDQIEVAPGTYNEAINFTGKAVRLYSTGGPAVTTIDGQGAYHVVQCVTGEGSNTILEGFTITGGNANSTSFPDNAGGGMLNDSSSPTVTNCVFATNSAGYGGGMYNYNNCSPTVTNCTFSGNRTYAGAKGADGGWEEGEDGGNGVAGGNGAGMYNDHSSPTITNCYFVNNQTGDGGSGGDGSTGVIRPGRGGDAENGGHGAGMYNDQCSPKVRGCTFSNNITGNGGNGGDGYNKKSGGKGKGGGMGAGVCNVDSSPEFDGCSFTGNKTGRGGSHGCPCWGAESDRGGDGAGMYSSGCSPLVVIDCSFTGNETGEGGPGGEHNGSGGRAGDGAGMYNWCSNATVTNCTFAGNETGKGGNGRGGTTTSIQHPSGGLGGCGAGMYNSGGSVTVNNCTFGGNVTGPGGVGRDGQWALYGTGGFGSHGGNGGDGAGMHNRDCNPVVTHCSFLGNATGDGGDGGNGGWSSGGMGGDGGNGGNGGFGAGMYNDSCSPTLNDCAFIENVAGSRGTRGSYGEGLPDGSRGQWGLPGTAGMANLSSSPTVTNCTFHDNSSDNGAGLYNHSSSNPLVTNCILWDITSTEIYNDSSTPVVTYSDVKGGTGQSWFGEGCIDIYPMFAYSRLLPGSSCIDAGNNSAVPADITTDLDGNPRIVDGDLDGQSVVDMGAYEAPGALCVPDNYATIQAAIDAAPSSGAQILVAPGTYKEAINFNGKAIRLYSRDGAEVTTIDATGLNSSVVTCASGENADTILEGFTITGGNADIGGGMLNNNSSPTVNNCTFRDNKAYTYGGGICNWESSPIVTNCTFTHNTATDGGGGMYNYSASSPTVSNCIFRGNWALTGGGMYNGYSNSTVTNCTFISNTGTGGAGMYNTYSSPTVTNCTFSGNQAYGYGGGMSNGSGSNPILTNCIFWGNSATSSSQIYGTATVCFSDIQGGWTGSGNINLDPQFADAAGRLSNNSPCIDAGDNTAVSGVATDLDGNPRVTDGDGDGDPVVDMGAYESQAGPIHNITQDLWYWTIQSALDHSHDGDQIEVPSGTYNEAINFLGKAVRLYSTGGPEVTTIDATGLDSTVVTCNSGESANTILEGFTITGGNAIHGGGMYNNGSRPTVKNCIFASNDASRGGGMLNDENSSPTVTNCIFISNTGEYGAGMYNAYGSNSTVTDCTFENNNAAWFGGGMDNDHESSPTVTNCRFSSDYGYYGGGMFNGDYCSPTVVNCTFIGNSAGFGGAIYGVSGSPTVTNCILWGDTPDEIFVDGSNPTIRYSDVSGGWPGMGNINLDPEFADAEGRLSPGSPCIDTGNNSAVGVASDLDGNPRIMAGHFDGDAVVDMGAYEYEYVWGDADSDGIEDSVDTEPLVYSNDFEDGLTSGTVVDRAHQILVIVDAPDPCGVRISALGGTAPAQVSVCGAAVFTLDAGDAVVATCGSINIVVVQGTVEIVFTAADGTQVQTSLNEGNAIAFEPQTCAITAPATNSEVVVVVVDGGEIVLTPGQSKLLAKVDIDPDMLNLKSGGPGIACYIELAENYDVREIKVDTLVLNGQVPAEPEPTEVGDYDSDGVPDLMVKFDRSATQALLEAGDAVQITVAGQLNDGTEFEGCDVVRVIAPGQQEHKESRRARMEERRAARMARSPLFVLVSRS